METVDRCDCGNKGMKAEVMPKKQTVYLYVLDTMADWEFGYIAAELNSGRYFKKGLAPLNVVTVGINKVPVTTMGGLKILPDTGLDTFSFENAAALILPGGSTWTETLHDPILEIAELFLNHDAVVAAICGATFGLARKGLLDSRWHTSNNLEYLKTLCPGYAGEKYYKQEAAVTDGNLITASGISPIEFSVHVLRALDVFSAETLDAWNNLFRTQNSEYFYAMMNSIQ